MQSKYLISERPVESMAYIGFLLDNIFESQLTFQINTTTWKIKCEISQLF